MTALSSDPSFFAQTPRPDAVRGHIVHFLADPATHGNAAREHFPDGLLILRDGHVAECGPYEALAGKLPRECVINDHRGSLILPGMIDTHVHYSQIDMIASYGEQLLAWLDKYTFPTERRFADFAYASDTANFFCDELLRNGTTTAMVLATVHPVSVEALFESARTRRMRMIAGKVLMNRNCPDFLRDVDDGGEAESRRLIERWHGTERLAYAITPRFAPTSTRAQMEMAGRLFAEYDGIYLQSHLAENAAEVAWVRELYPEARSYLDVYDRYGQLGPRSLYAHCLWIDEEDRRRCADSGAAMSFCPTSNLFLGSGLFDFAAAQAAGVRIGLGSDVGGGTTLSMLKTLGEAYKVLQLQGQKLSAAQAFYLATLGSARSLRLEAHIGNFACGREADFVVLDPHSTPLLRRRLGDAATLDEQLFSLMTLGDDRVVAATYLLGHRVWQRSADE